MTCVASASDCRARNRGSCEAEIYELQERLRNAAGTHGGKPVPIVDSFATSSYMRSSDKPQQHCNWWGGNPWDNCDRYDVLFLKNGWNDNPRMWKPAISDLSPEASLTLAHAVALTQLRITWEKFPIQKKPANPDVVRPRVAPGTCSGSILAHTQLVGHDDSTTTQQGPSIAACRAECMASATCTHYTWDGPAVEASQSSTANGAGAARAIDGDANVNFNGNSCTRTTVEQAAWWQVDLGAEQTIETVAVTNSADSDLGAALNGFYISVDGTVCADNIQIDAGATLAVPCAAAAGRVVRIGRPGPTTVEVPVQRVVNGADGLCLRALGGASYSEVKMGSCSTGSEVANEVFWTLDPSTGLLANAQGGCLDFAVPHIYTCSTGNHNQPMQHDVGTGSITHNGKCLAATSDGGIKLEACITNSDGTGQSLQQQTWTFVDTGTTVTKVVDNLAALVLCEVKVLPSGAVLESSTYRGPCTMGHDAAAYTPTASPGSFSEVCAPSIVGYIAVDTEVLVGDPQPFDFVVSGRKLPTDAWTILSTPTRTSGSLVTMLGVDQLGGGSSNVGFHWLARGCTYAYSNGVQLHFYASRSAGDLFYYSITFCSFCFLP